MSDVANTIMDAAERRIRTGGFNGFSFREIASDVGIKSSSVHYHFPTKEKLTAAVIRRYTDRMIERMAGPPDQKAILNPRKVWITTFRETLHADGHMCPCIVLGAASGDLPTEVAVEVRRFFNNCLEILEKSGLSSTTAHEFLAMITGAIVLASALGDLSAYDRATKALIS